MELHVLARTNKTPLLGANNLKSECDNHQNFINHEINHRPSPSDPKNSTNNFFAPSTEIQSLCWRWSLRVHRFCFETKYDPDLGSVREGRQCDGELYDRSPQANYASHIFLSSTLDTGGDKSPMDQSMRKGKLNILKAGQTIIALSVAMMKIMDHVGGKVIFVSRMGGRGRNHAVHSHPK
jgi:hypothetical protein